MPRNSRFLATTMFSGMVGAVLFGPGGAYAADLVPAAAITPKTFEIPPAVDGINYKFVGLGGTLDNRPLGGASGAVSIPLARSIGFQADGAAGSLSGQFFGSVAGHLFWRDPGQGLIGLYASHTYWNMFGGAYVSQVAGEGEYYYGRFTVQGVAGVEFGNNATNVTTGTFVTPPAGGLVGAVTTTTFVESFNVKTRFFDQLNLKYYFTDNWDGYVGHRYLGGKNALALGTEVALPGDRRSMTFAFVEARFGEGEYRGVFGGLKLYFGQKDKTLIQRHRQDDPNLWDSLHSIANTHQTSSSSASTFFCNPGDTLAGGTCTPPPPPPSGEPS